MKIKYLWYRQSSSLRVLAIFLGYHSAAFFLASQDSFWIGTKSLKSVKNGRGSRFSVYDLLHPLRCLRTCIPRKTHQSGGEKCRFAVHHCPASPCHVSFEMIGRWVGLGGATPSLFHLILEATEREWVAGVPEIPTAHHPCCASSREGSFLVLRSLKQDLKLPRQPSLKASRIRFIRSHTEPCFL